MFSYPEIQRILSDANDRITGEITELDAGPNELRRLALTFGQVRCVLEAADAFTPDGGRVITPPAEHTTTSAKSRVRRI